MALHSVDRVSLLHSWHNLEPWSVCDFFNIVVIHIHPPVLSMEFNIIPMAFLPPTGSFSSNQQRNRPRKASTFNFHKVTPAPPSLAHHLYTSTCYLGLVFTMFSSILCSLGLFTSSTNTSIQFFRARTTPGLRGLSAIIAGNLSCHQNLSFQRGSKSPQTATI